MFGNRLFDEIIVKLYIDTILETHTGIVTLHAYVWKIYSPISLLYTICK